MVLSNSSPQQRTSRRTPTRKRSLEAHLASPRLDYQIYCLPHQHPPPSLVKEDDKISDYHQRPYQNVLLEQKDSPPIQKRQHKKRPRLLTHSLLSLLLLSTLYCVIPLPRQYTKKSSLQEKFEQPTILQSDKLESKKTIGICGWLQFSTNCK